MLQEQAGNSLEMSLALVSLLRGFGFMAFVVLGKFYLWLGKFYLGLGKFYLCLGKLYLWLGNFTYV